MLPEASLLCLATAKGTCDPPWTSLSSSALVVSIIGLVLVLQLAGRRRDRARGFREIGPKLELSLGLCIF
jgi:hypothetical protein